MSKNVRTPDSCIREFIKAEFINSKEYTRQKCEWSLHRTKRLLEAASFDASPYKIDAKAIDFLLNEGWSGHQVSYKKKRVQLPETLPHILQKRRPKTHERGVPPGHEGERRLARG